MKYPKTATYPVSLLREKIMGPNPLKLTEELLLDNRIMQDAVVLDLGSGTGITSVFMAKEYPFHMVYAADLWSDPKENQEFFDQMGVPREKLKAVKADATNLPFPLSFFDAVVSSDSYNYFGRDPHYLDAKLLPFVKRGGYLYLCVPGMKKDLHENLPEELLLSWNKEQLDYIHDIPYWKAMIGQAQGCETVSVSEMETGGEAWDDWLACDNEYAKGDRKSMDAGAGKYLNFIKMVLRKR